MIKSENFIFHTSAFPFSIPYRKKFTVNTTGSVTANQTKTLYGSWTTITGSKLGMDTIFTMDGKSQLNWVELELKMSGSTRQVIATPSVEMQNGQVRAVLKVQNLTASAQTFTAKDVQYEIFMYQLNNTI